MYYVHLLLVIAVAYLVLLGYALSRPRTPATLFFSGVLVVSMVWALTYYMEIVLPHYDSKVAARLVRLVFLPWINILWLASLRSLIGVGRGLPRWFWIAICALAAATSVVAATSLWHRWFVYDMKIFLFGPSATGLGILTFERGWWYRIYELAQALIFPGLNLVLMTRAFRGASPIMRRQLVLLLICYTAPAVASAAFSLNLFIVPHINLAPFAMGLSVAALGWVMFRYRSLDILPVAREALLDQLQALVFVADPNDRLVDLNKAALAMVGGPLVKWVGQPLASLPAPWNRIGRETEGKIEVEIEGRHRWLDCATSRLHDAENRSIGALHILRDITSQHEAEIVVRESREQLQRIVDSIMEAIFIHDFDGRVRAVNKPMLDMFGLSSAEQAMGLNVLKDCSAPDNDPDRARSAFHRARQGEKVLIPQWRARKPLTGETFDIRITVQPVVRGSETLLLATVLNITEELDRQRRELDYQRLMDERKYVRQIEMLIRDLHDGLGGVMTGISLVSTLGLRAGEPAAREEALRKIADLAGEGHVEVRSLMNTLETREFFWADLIKEFRRHGTAVQENHNIHFHLRLEGEGDPGGPGLFPGMSLYRIFKEAVNNVVKHSKATEVRVGLSFSSDRMTLTIADNGRGRAGDGVGRGLRNMRLRIEEFGGAMTVKNGDGFQLEFTAPLPVKSPE